MTSIDRTTAWVVAFGGAGREGVVHELLKNGIRIEAVIVPQRRSTKLDAAVQALRSTSLQVVETTRRDLEAVFRGFRGSALLSVGFPYIIPAAVLSHHPVAMNLHPTLLPKYRGPTSAAYILLNDEQESGSTAHLMTANVDDGRIIAQRQFTITPFDTVRSVQRKSYALEPALVMEALEALFRGSSGVEQEESQATSFPDARSPEDSRIDPELPLVDLINAVRASDPDNFPAFFDYRGEKLCIKLWRPAKAVGEEDCL